MNFKAQLQTESLNAIRAQVDTSNLALKEKQNELIHVERKLNRITESINDSEMKADQLRQSSRAQE